jgi:hypothetical protein
MASPAGIRGNQLDSRSGNRNILSEGSSIKSLRISSRVPIPYKRKIAFPSGGGRERDRINFFQN